MEHIYTKNMSDSKLYFESICSVGIFASLKVIPVEVKPGPDGYREKSKQFLRNHRFYRLAI